MKASTNPSAYFRDQHSFFDDLVTMLMSLSSYMFTLHCSILSNNPREFKDRTLEEWINYIRPIKQPEFPFYLDEVSTGSLLAFYPAMIVMEMSLNSWPKAIEYRSIETLNSTDKTSVTSNENRLLISRIVGSSFVNYYASQEDNIRSKYGDNTDVWPKQINFARVVRNGFAHGGVFHILNPKAIPVKWRIWSIDHSQNGKPVLFGNGNMAIGDIVRLMEDVDLSLH
jgi:hypothetical protein